MTVDIENYGNSNNNTYNTSKNVTTTSTGTSSSTDTHQLLANLKARMEELERHCHFEHPPTISRTTAAVASDNCASSLNNNNNNNDDSVDSTVAMSMISSSSLDELSSNCSTLSTTECTPIMATATTNAAAVTPTTALTPPRGGFYTPPRRTTAARTISQESTTCSPIATVITPPSSTTPSTDTSTTTTTTSHPKPTALTPSAQARRDRIAKLRQTKRNAEHTQTSLFDGLVLERKCLQTENVQLKAQLQAQTSAWEEERTSYRHAISEMNTLITSLQQALCRTSPVPTSVPVATLPAVVVSSPARAGRGRRQEENCDESGAVSPAQPEVHPDIAVEPQQQEGNSTIDSTTYGTSCSTRIAFLQEEDKQQVDKVENEKTSTPPPTTTTTTTTVTPKEEEDESSALTRTFQNTRSVIEKLDEDRQQMAIENIKQASQIRYNQDVIQKQKERIMELEELQSLQTVKIHSLQDMVVQSLQLLQDCGYHEEEMDSSYNYDEDDGDDDGTVATSSTSSSSTFQKKNMHHHHHHHGTTRKKSSRPFEFLPGAATAGQKPRHRVSLQVEASRSILKTLSTKTIFGGQQALQKVVGLGLGGKDGGIGKNGTIMGDGQESITSVPEEMDELVASTYSEGGDADSCTNTTPTTPIMNSSIGQKVQRAGGGIKDILLEQREKANNSNVLKTSRNVWATLSHPKFGPKQTTTASPLRVKNLWGI